MKGNPKLIATLNDLLADELTAINQYMVHSEMADGWGYEKLHKAFEQRAIQEMKHAESLIGRILFLEGTPTVSKLNKLMIGADVPKQLAGDRALEMMAELQEIKREIHPAEILFVADAMTGQDAVNVAAKFNELLGVDGVIMTKMDGDARGGAALSLKAVLGKPIKFVGVGEKIDALEVFHPERMASRILGMGDVLTLVEKAQATVDAKEAQELQRKIRKNEFSLEDFRSQLKQIRKMGSLQDLLGMIPGFSRIKSMKHMVPDEKELVRISAIIDSMTKKERRNHLLIDGERRKRIAKGSGTTVQDVNLLLKNYAEMRKMMKKFSSRDGMKALRRGNFPFA
ncbi:MAG: Signal recognition particle protein [Syntrophaceae bacterium PtaU1.Bin231]|nr:MAG: Signal recognition particle protein [Syntrophaceae bacterium PtaU1.Bin231]